MTQAPLFRCLGILCLVLGLAAPAAAQSFPPFDVDWQETNAASFNSVAFSPDGSLVGAGANFYDTGRLLVHNSADGSGGFTRDFGADINAVVFTPDGTGLIAAHAGGSCQPNGGCGGFGNLLSRWSVASGTLVTSRPFPQAYLSMVFSPDGQTIAGGNRFAQAPYNAVRFHAPTTLDSVGFLPAVTASEVAFSPDGTRLVTGGFESLQYTGDARVWDTATGALLLELPHRAESRPYRDEFPDAVAYSPDGQFIVTGGWGSPGTTVIVWRASDGSLVHRFDARSPGRDCGSYGLGTHVAVSPNGRYVAGATSCEPSGRADLIVRFWDIATGELMRTYGMAGFPGVRGMSDFALSPTENQMAFTFASGTRTSALVVASTDLNLTRNVVAGEAGPPADPLQLSAPAPSPAADRTTLTLAVSEVQHVTVTLYDALGRQVEVLSDGIVSPGTPTVLAVEAARLSPGVYVVRAAGTTGAATRRMLVVH